MQKLFCVLLSVLFVGLLVVGILNVADAANYTLYSSVGQNDTNTNNLVGLYLNSSDYDPYNQYICCRVGQYDYMLFYGKDLTEDYQYYRYYGQYEGQQLRYYYMTGNGSNLNINYNNFVVVGNVPGSINSEKASSFGFQYVVTVLCILLAILVIFKTFRKVYRPRSDRGYTL